LKPIFLPTPLFCQKVENKLICGLGREVVIRVLYFFLSIMAVRKRIKAISLPKMKNDSSGGIMFETIPQSVKITVFESDF